MKPEQFKTLSYITSEMLSVNAGANVKGMDYETVLKMDNFAADMLDRGYQVVLMHNGCNTGLHDSPEHPKGKAIDFTVIPIRPDLHKNPVWLIVLRLAYHGFTAIGVYKNHKRYFSYHADGVRDRQWFQLIKKDGSREQFSLLNDRVF